MNPTKLLKNIDLGAVSQLRDILESMHEYLEQTLEENKKTNQTLDEIKELLEQDQ